MNNQMFLQTVALSFKEFLLSGSRSNEKLKILHGSIAKDLHTRLGYDYEIRSLGFGSGREAEIKGRYIDKKVDITILKNDETIAGIGVKFVMQNYAQNSNNYFENMLGETANIRSKQIPYFQIFIIPDKMPYYKNDGTFTNWETFSEHNAIKYMVLSKDNIEINTHTPTKTLLFVVHLPEIDINIANRYEYIKYYQDMDNLTVCESTNIYGNFHNSVIYNDYETFIEKVCHYIFFFVKTI